MWRPANRGIGATHGNLHFPTHGGARTHTEAHVHTYLLNDFGSHPIWSANSCLRLVCHRVDLATTGENRWRGKITVRPATSNSIIVWKAPACKGACATLNTAQYIVAQISETLRHQNSSSASCDSIRNTAYKQGNLLPSNAPDTKKSSDPL